MKFQNAILSIATALSGANNNMVDAKIWNLRGFGNANNNNEVMMKNDEVINHSESLVGEELPSPSANMGELLLNEQQGERRLPKKKKNKGEDKGGDDEEGASKKKKKGGDKKKKGGDKKKKGEKVQEIGDATLVGAPEDATAKAGCDELEDDDGDRFRRILKKGKSKANKEDVSSGVCDSCTTSEDRTEADIAASHFDVPVEVPDDPTCDPDDKDSCVETGAGDDDTLTPPEEGEGASPEEGEVGAEFEATSRQLMDGRRLTGNTNQIGQFAPLSCNPVEFDCTGAAGLSTVVGGGAVVVPCGTCLVYDLGAEATIGGLNIIGKLLVPTNYKSTLSTPYVFVQGELEMSDDQPISEDNTSMKIVLTGNTDVMFTPHEPVAGAASLNAGEKPFLVAGGKLNIRGWDDVEGSGKTWTPILAMAEADRLYPDPIVGETAARNALPHLKNPTITCPNKIVHDFEGGVDFSVWKGGDGNILSYDEANEALTATNLRLDSQGFRLDFTKLTKDCPITQDVTYLVTIRLKIEDPTLDDGAVSICETNNHKDHCPKLGRSIVKAEGKGWLYDKEVNLLPSSIGRNNEWFTFASEWTWSAAELTDDVAQVFYLKNFKPGQIIHMDEFQFELPSPKAYAPVEDPCLELVVNGDAENADGRGWHHYPMWSGRTDRFIPTILEETVDGAVNKYWHIENRVWIGDSLRFHVNHQCFMLGSTYAVSLRARFTGKTHPVKYWFEIKGNTATKGYRYQKPLYCPSQSAADGWVTCSGDFVVDEYYEFTSSPEIILVTQDENDSTGYVDWDFDDVSIKFKSGPAAGLEVSGSDAARWGVNSDVHITSSTLHGQDAQDGRVKAVSQKANGNVVLELENPITPVFSEKETPGYGVEIAVTSRNIKIIGEDDGTYNGGYLQVFHTPGVAQVIEGVEFFNMGQSSRKNRFAIQLLYNGDVEGTSISSNSIRQSNMRCISVDGTANATIASNVGAGITGHCFYFDRISADNMVMDNLASNMNNRIGWNNRIDGWDDYDADGFAIWSPFNHFIGNVAAGGHKRGFRYYLDWRTLGEDLINVGPNMRRNPIGTFKDNKAHSNWRQGFHLADFEQFFQFRDPENVPVFENLSAYRNREQGIYSYNCVYCKFIGGFLSDNQKGIEIRRSDGITLQDFVIQGQTELFKNYVTDNNSHKLCGHSGWTYEGIHMMGTLWRYGHLDPGFGIRVKNVVLSGFDKEKEYYDNCPSTEPIGFSTDTHYGGHFDYKTSFENVTVDDGRDIILDGCRAASYGYPDIAFNDIDGSLDPDKSASNGVLVTDQPYMTGLFGDKCKSTAGCMSYCAEICLGMVTFFTERFGTENYKLKVTDTASGLSIDIPGNVRTYNERWNTYAYDGGAERTFAASLPAGQYTAEFVDEFGNTVWPMYAEEQWAQAPDCNGGVSIGDITVIKPAMDAATECVDMVRNGDSATRSDVTPWIHTKWYGEIVNELKPGEGIDGGNAIAMDRTYHWTGIAQNLNSMCTDAREGEWYEFSAWMKMTDANGNPSTNIDPNREWWRNQAPILTINDRQYRDTSTKQHLYNAEHRNLAALTRPYNNDEWGHVHGIFKMPTSPRLWFELERAPDNVKFLLDSASLTPLTCNRDGLVRNGNLETNDSAYWDIWGGGDVVLDFLPGAGPNGGNALKTSSRVYHSWTQSQVLNIDCVNAGDRIAFSAKIKTSADCLIYSWDYNQRCNDIFFHTDKDNVREYTRVGYITADTPDEGGWHHVHGIHIHSENGEKPDLAKLYFADANPNWDVYTADVKAYVLEQNCQALVENSDMEEKDLYWTYTDRDRSKVKVITPGAGGSGHALRLYDRDHSWRGLRQVLDPRCFVPGEEFTINAKFRLTDALLAGVACVGTECPIVKLYGRKCPNGDVTEKFSNVLDMPWDSEGWNNYEATFAVSDEIAACGSVELWIHEVNPSWNIEIDDVQINANA